MVKPKNGEEITPPPPADGCPKSINGKHNWALHGHDWVCSNCGERSQAM